MASYMGHEYTPAPTQVVQGRYRVGDRVRVVKDGFELGGSYHAAKVGDIDEITAVDMSDDNPYEGKIWYYKPHEITPAFRPGDRVKLNKHSGFRACGERGTVSAVIGDNVSVRMDDASAYGTVVAFFHADNLDWERVEDCPVKAEPKFKAGDRVTYVPGADMDGHFMTIKSFRGDYHEPAYWFEEGGFDVERLLMLAAPCPQDNEQDEYGVFNDGERIIVGKKPFRWGIQDTCIVALVKNGQPRPSSYPHVHASVAAATKEAERLARINPGQEFAVYQRVAGRVAEVSVEMKKVA